MLKRRVTDSLTMLFVCGLSLLLVVYVGFGEAQRTFTQFHVEKLHAQGQILQTAMSGYLRAGLPLRQYVGFSTRADAVLASDSSVSTITVFDSSGRTVFTRGDREVELLQPGSDVGESEGSAGIDLRQDDEFLQVVLPLSNKFEMVGSLVISTPREIIKEQLSKRFKILLTWAGILSAGFAIFVATFGPRLAAYRAPWLQIVYAMTFLAMSAMVVGILISVYSEGAQAKTKSLADSLGQRLRDIVDFNINIHELDGIDQVFAEYRGLNPDISALALIVNRQVVIHSDASKAGGPWTKGRGSYEFTIDLTRLEENANNVEVAVVLPRQVVSRQVLRSVKNFAALFVASAFMAGLFLHLARSLQWLGLSDNSPEERRRSWDFTDFDLSLIKAIFFVAVLCEHMIYSFFPQFVTQLLTESGAASSLISTPFMAYYLCFALSLIPAGHYAQWIGPRRLIYIGLSLASFSLLSLAFVHDIMGLTLARAAAGIGQGILFIGVQCYILAKAPPEKKTQGAGIIVFGFQGGMISGMAIGSLLVVYMGPQVIFLLAGGVAAAATVYAIFLVPAVSPKDSRAYQSGSDLRWLGRNLWRMMCNLEFFKTIILIGIPAKAVMTGIIIFALPLILAQQKYAQEDIGQIIMLYAIGVLAASTCVSRLVDQTGKTESILFWGAFISGAGLLMVGFSGFLQHGQLASDGRLASLATIVGVTIVGLAHGFINAPVVTHVADSKLAQEIGPNTATAGYRFLERVGHVAGPIVVGQLFFFTGQSAAVIGWIGGVVAVLGIVFILACTPGSPRSPNREYLHESAP